MRYAALRASQTGGAVEMLAVVSPEEFQHFMGVADVMRAEAHEKIEAHFQVFKDRMEKREGITPTLVVREGDKVEAVIEHLKYRPRDRRPGGRRRHREGRPRRPGQRPHHPPPRRPPGARSPSSPAR